MNAVGRAVGGEVVEMPQLALHEAHLRGETPAYRVEHRIRHHDGHWIWVLDHAMVMEFDAQGQLRNASFAAYAVAAGIGLHSRRARSEGRSSPALSARYCR